jgi:hypothetical protein
MSQENGGLARAAFKAWNAGDMNAFVRLLDVDVVLRAQSAPSPGDLNRSLHHL